MKKRELITENQQLRRQFEKAETSHRRDRDKRDRQLIKLGLIPDRYTRYPHGFLAIDGDDPVIDWRQVEADLKDLATYKSVERGRELAENPGKPSERPMLGNPSQGGIMPDMPDLAEKLREMREEENAANPWLDADHREIWDIEIDGEAILCRSDSDGDFTPIFGHQHWAKIANGSDRITAGRRVWPDKGASK